MVGVATILAVTRVVCLDVFETPLFIKCFLCRSANCVYDRLVEIVFGSAFVLPSFVCVSLADFMA